MFGAVATDDADAMAPSEHEGIDQGDPPSGSRDPGEAKPAHGETRGTHKGEHERKRAEVTNGFRHIHEKRPIPRWARQKSPISFAENAAILGLRA
jgi:hypothetical protein